MSKQASPSSQPSQPQGPQSSVDTAAVESSIEAREQEQKNIDAQQEQGVTTPQQAQREKELEEELAALKQMQVDKANEVEALQKQLRESEAAKQKLEKATTEAAAQAAAAKIAPAARNFKVPAGEEGYTHSLVTKLNGVALSEPMVQAFHADQYEQISKTPGFEATVLHKGKEEE